MNARAAPTPSAEHLKENLHDRERAHAHRAHAAALEVPELPDCRVMLRWMRAAVETDAESTVRFVDLEEGRELNHQFRGRDSRDERAHVRLRAQPVVMADIVIAVPVLVREGPKSRGRPSASISRTCSSTASFTPAATTTSTRRRPRD